MRLDSNGTTDFKLLLINFISAQVFRQIRYLLRFQHNKIASTENIYGYEMGTYIDAQYTIERFSSGSHPYIDTTIYRALAETVTAWNKYTLPISNSVKAMLKHFGKHSVYVDVRV